MVDVVQFVKPSKFKTAVSVCEGRGKGTGYYHVYNIPSKFNIEVTHSSICGGGGARWLDVMLYVIPSELIPAGLGVTKTVFYIDNSVSAQVILCKTYSAEITVLCIDYTLCVKHIYLKEGSYV